MADTTSVRDLALKAKEASRGLAALDNDARLAALAAMAAGLRAHKGAILDANAADMAAAREKGTSAGLLDRLFLDEGRIEDMAAGIEALAALPDPVGRVLEEREIACGLHLQRVSVPLGVVAMIYEARPNVTSDAAAICIRTGNACVLRGGSLAQSSCVAIARTLAEAAEGTGCPVGSIAIVDTPDRAATDELMSLRGIVDVLIPRGGAGLIQHCVEHAQVPVIETGTGNCHVYVHASADFDKARAIIVNAKTQRVGVCNACESVLVDAAVADEFLPLLFADLAEHEVLVHGDMRTCVAATTFNALREDLIEDGERKMTPLKVTPATTDDWGREYLALEISVKQVSGVDQAIAHINRYGTGHSEAIVAEDKDVCEKFLREVDAAAVYANASTRFTDGGQFGLGAEIGISTQKLHVRGPFAAEALTSSKYVIRGDGQVRP